MRRRLALLLTGMLLLCGCTGRGPEPKSSASPESSAPAAPSSVDEASEALEAFYAADSQWCNGLWNGAVEKLYASGAVEKSDELFRYFTFLPDGQIAFASEEAKERLTDPGFTIDGKAIVAILDVNNPEDARALVIHDDSTPAGSLPSYGMSSWDIPRERIAETREDCDYLILYGGLFSDYEKNYYIGGHRITVTTLVFVIDTKTGEIVHIETIGVDRPGSSTKTPKGKTYVQESIDYLSALLGSKKEASSLSASFS